METEFNNSFNYSTLSPSQGEGRAHQAWALPAPGVSQPCAHRSPACQGAMCPWRLASGSPPRSSDPSIQLGFQAGRPKLREVGPLRVLLAGSGSRCRVHPEPPLRPLCLSLLPANAEAEFPARSQVQVLVSGRICANEPGWLPIASRSLHGQAALLPSPPYGPRGERPSAHPRTRSTSAFAGGLGQDLQPGTDRQVQLTSSGEENWLQGCVPGRRGGDGGGRGHGGAAVRRGYGPAQGQV